MAGYETSGAKDYYPLDKPTELFEVLPCALCTDGIDQRLFLFGGAVQLLYLGNDGIRMSLRNTLLQLSGIRGLMDHDIEPVYRFFHRSIPPCLEGYAWLLPIMPPHRPSQRRRDERPAQPLCAMNFQPEIS